MNRLLESVYYFQKGLLFGGAGARAQGPEWYSNTVNTLHCIVINTQRAVLLRDNKRVLKSEKRLMLSTSKQYVEIDIFMKYCKVYRV